MAPAHAAAYWIKAVPQVTGPLTVRVKVTSNLPGGAWISAYLRFADLKPNDPALGAGLHRTNLKNGQATFQLDERKATSTMPRGEYEVVVFYSPFSPENGAYAKRNRLEQFVETRPVVRLEGDGVAWRDLRVARARYDTLGLGLEYIKWWTLDKAALRYGRYQAFTHKDLPSEGVRGYYFPAVDATFVADARGSLIEIRGGRYSR